MKRLVLQQPLPGPKGFENWVTDTLREIERLTVEDIEQVVKEFSTTGAFTETRTLNVTTATASDIAAFLATLLSDIKKGGQKRSYGS